MFENRPDLVAAAERQGKRVPKIEFPYCVEHVWNWFWDLSRRRTQGPNPLSYAEILSWIQVTRTPVLPCEVSMLMAMDTAYLSAAAKKAEQRRELSKSKAKKR